MIKASGRTLFVAAGLLMLVSCKPTVPKQFIQPDDMEDLLYDYHLAQSMSMNEGGSPEQRDYTDMLYFYAVLEKHGISRADFDSSLIYYYTRAEYLHDIYRNVAKRLSEEALNMGASEGEVNRFMSLSSTGDTANVWLGDLSAVLLPYAPYNRFDFTQKADTSYRKGDVFMMTFSSDFFYQSGIKNATACLSVRYDNDSLVSVAIPLSVTGQNNLRLPEAPNLTAKDLSGFIYFGQGDDNSTTLKMLYVKDIRLIRFHQKTKDATTDENEDSREPDKAENSGEPVDKLRRDTLLQIDTVGGGAVRRNRQQIPSPDGRGTPDRVAGRKLPPPVR